MGKMVILQVLGRFGGEDVLRLWCFLILYVYIWMKKWKCKRFCLGRRWWRTMIMMIQMINAYDYMDGMLPTFMVSCRKISILSRKCPTFRGTEGYAKENPIELGLPKKPRGSCGKIWGFQNSSVDFYVFLGGGKWIWDIYVYYIYIHILFDINIYELYMMVYHTSYIFWL